VFLVQQQEFGEYYCHCWWRQRQGLMRLRLLLSYSQVLL
jgi:hypothetical protein